MSNNISELKKQIKTAQMNISAKWSMRYRSMTPEIEEELAKVLQDEIDAIALYEIYISLGWYGFENYHTNKWPVNEVVDWLANNCIGKYFHTQAMCAFENLEDATKFNLTWC